MGQTGPYAQGKFAPFSRLAELCLVAIVMTTMFASSQAQRRTWNWFFGDKAGLNFSTGVPLDLTGGQINTEEGCATMSRRNTGQLLFYTDGVTVWNRLHEAMPNGFGLNGDPSTSQSALIVPWPNDDDRFVIFTPAPITSSNVNGRCFCLTYSIVDMKLNGGFGDVTQKNIVLDADVTEHVTATADCDQGGWWVVVRRRESPAFAAYHVTETGINTTPSISTIDVGEEVRDAGQMHISPNGENLVITSPAGSAFLYSFARSTGVAYGGVELFGGERLGSSYGATFSVDSRYVFIASSVESPASTLIHRFDIQAGDESQIVASRQQLASLSGTSAFTPMQLGPNGIVYIGRPGMRTLAAIDRPSDPFPVVQDSAVFLTGTCRSGLPNLIDWLLAPHAPDDKSCELPIAITQDMELCRGECVRLTDNSQGNIDSYSWNIPGAVPSSVRIKDPLVCFPTSGGFQAQLIVSNSSGSDTSNIIITVHPPPPLNVISDTSTCPGGSVTLWASGAATYLWSPSEGLDDPRSATPNATPTNDVTYTVIGTNTEGCSDTAIVHVAVRPLSGGPDPVICVGGSALLEADSADTYLWRPVTGLDDPTIRTPTARSLTETTTYTVRIQRGACVTVDTVVVRVVPSFLIDIEAPPSACDGEVVEVTAVGGGSEFAWSGDGVAASTTNKTTVTMTGSRTTVFVVARSGDCFAMDSVVIESGVGPDMTPTPDTAICHGEQVTLSVTGVATNIRWSPSSTLNTDIGATVVASPTQTTTYYIQSSQSSNCITVDSITVTVKPKPVIDAGADKGVCIGEETRISAIGNADTYIWEPATGLSDPTLLSPIARPSATTTYRLTATSAGCVSIDSMTVSVSELNLTLTPNPTICEGSAVELLAEGAAIYRWDPPTGLSDASIPNPIATPSVTTTYEVTGIDVLGCVDVKYVTVTVLDTTAITLVSQTVTAEAGSDSVFIPVIVEVDPSLLPLMANNLRVALVHRADVFLPTGEERGQIVTSIRGDDRVTYINLRNIQIVTPRQKLTSIFGQALLGRVESAELRWEDVQWTGLTCPITRSTPGRLLITGCNLQSRVIAEFDPTRVLVRPLPNEDGVDVTIDGTEPGEFVVRLVASDGRIINEQRLMRAFGATHELTTVIPMNAVSGGLYHVVVTAPSGPHIDRIAWMP